MLSFRLPDQFVNGYREKTPPWGFAAGGDNYLGEITFVRTYSHGGESWVDVCRRVVEGCYSIQKDWCASNRLPWSESKAVQSATEMFDRMFHFKWTPPGRGLWMMGRPFVHERQDGAALQNCGFTSTDDMLRAAGFLMEASMLGVGVGFDTTGAGKYLIHDPRAAEGSRSMTIEDSREGWRDSTVALLEAYLLGEPEITFDYSQIRPKGAPIEGFGGTAAGPQPLIDLHDRLRERFRDRAGEALTERDIVDVMNLIGVCVVAGNVRRSAEIALGSDRDEFLSLKDPEQNPERMPWAWASNNSVVSEVGELDYDVVADRIVTNGEPGIFYLDLARSYGRLVDPPNHRDYRASGTNPCSEQTLESREMCNLVETFPANHKTLKDFRRTLKFAYLYAKTVTLMPTTWPETNAIMQRNRRIGCSVSGVTQFAAQRGLTELRTWLDQGYREIQKWDNIYSEWLTIRESIKTTSVKPSGTVSLLVGATPGAHYPTAGTYIRRITLGQDDPLVPKLEAAGYPIEASAYSSGSVVAELPVQGPTGVPTEGEVSIWQKAAIAILLQRYWADNQVSATLTFDPDTEAGQVAELLRTHEGQMKSASFLPMSKGVFEQMPYEEISQEEYERRAAAVSRIPDLYGADREADGERFCETDRCEIPIVKT